MWKTRWLRFIFYCQCLCVVKLFLVIWLFGWLVNQSGSPIWRIFFYWQFATACVVVSSEIYNIPGRNQECRYEHKKRWQRLTASRQTDWWYSVSSEVMPQDGQDCTYTQILTKESSHEPQQGLDTKTDWLTISHKMTWIGLGLRLSRGSLLSHQPEETLGTRDQLYMILKPLHHITIPYSRTQLVRSTCEMRVWRRLITCLTLTVKNRKEMDTAQTLLLVSFQLTRDLRTC